MEVGLGKSMFTANQNDLVKFSTEVEVGYRELYTIVVTTSNQVPRYTEHQNNLLITLDSRAQNRPNYDGKL
jgi:hypothetical protein